MPRDRRRGRRPHRPAPRPSPVKQQPGQITATARPQVAERAAPVAKAPPTVKMPLLANPHLGKDLRNIGAVATVLVVLLVVLSIVL